MASEMKVKKNDGDILTTAKQYGIFILPAGKIAVLSAPAGVDLATAIRQAKTDFQGSSSGGNAFAVFPPGVEVVIVV